MEFSKTSDFYPRPPRGGRPQNSTTTTATSKFLSTPSARRATGCAFSGHRSGTISIHALREEGDENVPDFLFEVLGFLSTPSARRATHEDHRGDCVQLFLSTPSARRATEDEQTLLCYGLFLSTPSARRATRTTAFRTTTTPNFYPRPPRGGRRTTAVCSLRASRFLSTPSARRATHLDFCRFCFFSISIHALREEGDFGALLVFVVLRYFYPRPPRGGRHADNAPDADCARISIHALREEGDRRCAAACGDAGNFYPRPPRGGRPLAVIIVSSIFKFLSTPSARRATRLPTCKACKIRYFYPRPPRGGRPRARGSTTTLINFYPRPPRGGRPKISPNRTSPRKFLSTPSARRATYRDAKSEPSMDISIHALREEGDCTAFSTNSSSRLFLSTPSARRATLRKGLGVQHQRISIHALREEGDGLRRTF